VPQTPNAIAISASLHDVPSAIRRPVVNQNDFQVVPRSQNGLDYCCNSRVFVVGGNKDRQERLAFRHLRVSRDRPVQCWCSRTPLASASLTGPAFASIRPAFASGTLANPFLPNLP
jgi:hypothetical protein